MSKRFSVPLSLTLILVGSSWLAFDLAGEWLGLSLWWTLWRLWPLVIVSVGALMVWLPLLVCNQRWLGVLFIVGVPILATGGNLLFASVLNWWSAWAWLWPLEILAVALGFLLAALYTHWIWLTVPAIIIGLNGLAFQFCALTGFWGTWAILWTIEPLSVGLALLVVATRARYRVLAIVGLAFCGLAGLALAGMTLILSGWWLFNLMGPPVLIAVGLLLLAWQGLGRESSPTPV